MLQLFANSIVQEVHNEDGNFPRHRFDLLDFDKVESRKGLDYILTDIIGRVVSEGSIEQKKVKDRNVDSLMLELEDIWGKKLRITLWDRTVDEYQKQRVLTVDNLIIGVFTSNLVKEFMNNTVLSSTTASKVYLNLDIAEVVELKNKLRTGDVDEKIGALVYQRPIVDRAFILSNKKTISELLAIAATDFEEGIFFYCHATVSRICNNNGWYYNSCGRCKRIIKPAGDKFWCNNCQKVIDDAVPRYRLDVEVEDGTSATKFIIFDEEAEKLIGQSATSLYDIEEKEESLDSEGDLPTLITNLIQQSYVFRVKLTKYNKTAYAQSFTATKVLAESVIKDIAPTESQESAPIVAPDPNLHKSVSTTSEIQCEDITKVDENDPDSKGGPTKKRRCLRIHESDDESAEVMSVPN